jgi:hypothetical protein
MIVYQVCLATDLFKALSIDASSYRSDKDYDLVFRSLKFNGSSKEQWIIPKMHFRNPLKPNPDFWQLLSSSEAFAVGEGAFEAAYEFFEMAGELLPLTVKDMTLHICNVLQVYDCLDQERSIWNTLPGYTKRGPLVKPVFVPEHFHQSSLFKIPERLHTIYCWEADREPETEFKACVEKHKLKGLKFLPVWSDE